MRRRAIFVVVVSLGTSACFEPKRQLVLPPVPVVAKPAPPQPSFEDPPEINTPLGPISFSEVNLPASPEIEPPPAKPPQKRRTNVPATTPTPTPAGPTTVEPETPQTTPTPTTPQLSEILTEDRKRQYEAELASSVLRATAVVRKASSRTLNTRQSETLQRIKTFLEQAEESKGKDLAMARLLAQRADLLGQDLMNSLQ